MPLPLITFPDEIVQWVTLSARGSDTRAFLQGQLSADLSSLSADEWLESLLLAPDGSVITTVECRGVAGDDDGVDLVVRHESAETTQKALRRFLLRTRCEISVSGAATGPYTSVDEQIRLGEPGPNEFVRDLTPHSFGQAFVERRVSFSKGCFTGQELVGRLDARGAKVPFRLARVTGRDLEMMHQVVTSKGPVDERARQGLTTVSNDEGFIALAIVHRTLLDDRDNVEISGVRVESLHQSRDLDR